MPQSRNRWIVLLLSLFTVFIIIIAVNLYPAMISGAQLPVSGFPSTNTAGEGPSIISATPATVSLYFPFVFKGPASTQTPTPKGTPTAVSIPTSTPGGNPPGPGQWQQLGGNPQHTGYVAGNIATPWKVKWIWNGPANGGDSGPASDHLALPQDVQPVIGNGMLFIGHKDGMLRAISQNMSKYRLRPKIIKLLRHCSGIKARAD
jgi:hypothetical protein